MEKKKMLIGGEWKDAAESFTVASPFSGEKIAEIASASVDESFVSIERADKAVKEMAGLSRYDIANGLQKIYEGIAKRADEFANCIALESAKPMKYARGEVARAVSTFKWAAGEAERFVGDIVPLDANAAGRDAFGYTLRVPRGIIYGITPFNFPLNLVAHKVAPALASGNSIIIKPSQRTPLSALMLGEVFMESGLPSSAFQVVPMDVEHMEHIYNDERIAMISFTGGADVGWKIKELAGKKAVALELGGNAPVIIDDSADVADSVDKCVTGAFAFSGQVCISVQRVFVQDKLFDDWSSKFVEKARQLSNTNPQNEDCEFSVMIDESAAKRAESWIKEAADNNAEILYGGNREGAYLEPTVITKADPELKVVAEEAFAPVAIVERFGEFAEAVDRANNSKYGLQAAVFSREHKHIQYAAKHLQYGGVIINDSPTFRVDNMPYGGSKESGFGREGVRYAMEEMSENRVVVVRS